MAHLFIRHFNDDIYTLRVGSAQHVFTVHRNILNLSPVFACMTTSFFSESITKEIALPEDDVDSLGRIIEHLYGNNDAAFEVDRLEFDGARKLADLYGLAEKYQLPDLQDLVIQKLKQLDLLKEDRMTFFHIARQICQMTRDSDKIFVPYFEHQAAIHMRSMSEQEFEGLSELVCSGGNFARMIYQLQTTIYRKSQLNWLTHEVSLKQRVAVAENELQWTIQNTTADLAKAKRMHKGQHPACLQCHVLL